MIDIQNHRDFTKIEPINKGWSSDKKYYIETIKGEKLLLRISDISEYDKKQAGFEAVKLVAV
jgi:serine/threonine-protein kinase